MTPSLTPSHDHHGHTGHRGHHGQRALTNPIFLALDLPKLDTAEALARKVCGHIGGVKLGLEFFCAHGHHGVHALAQLGLPVFLDLKLHDIPNTVAATCQALRVLEPAILTVHAAGGRAMMEDAKAAAGERTRVVAVTVLTSLDASDLTATGVAADPHAQALRLAELAHDAGLDGIVCSGHEVSAVRRQWRDGFFVVPGLRCTEPAAHNGYNGVHAGHSRAHAPEDHGYDQKRVVTPRVARDAGASVLVIGRPITRAEDPLAAARAIEATL